MHARHAIIKLVLTLRDESRGTVISHILRLAAAIGLVAAFCGTLTAQARATTQPAAAQDELIPLYDGAQTADWAAACSKVNGANGGSFIIANVAQGPGVAPLARWRRVIDRCDAYERASVIGYVWTDYGEGERPASKALRHRSGRGTRSTLAILAGSFSTGHPTPFLVRP